ncbi:uncharacterized protein LOC134291230 [Aedes albopictus]|uniref:Integrase catalytic domain-containing protein n=1 Tax=Aedes albopictus TaxID=7160 RepID=A0ABM2A0Q4_AEDAL
MTRKTRSQAKAKAKASASQQQSHDIVTTALSSCGRSSTSSTRRARLARELALLEEERRLEEEARKEQLDRERLMNERAVNEKIERDKQYLARKRDLLIQQDEEDDIVSIRSHRSTHSTEKRIEDWIDTQEKPTSDAGTGVVGETSKPSAPTHHTPVKSAGAHGQQSTSTPIRDEQITNSEIPMKREPSNFIDLMSPTGSITIGESDPGEAAGGNSQVDDNLLSPAISLVNLNSLQNLLEEQKPIVHHTGALPKLARNALLPYGQWQRDTALRRKTNELEQRHQSEIDTRRRRELDLVDEIKRLQLQKDSDIEKFRKHEADTQKRLQEFSDRQTALELRRHEELQQRDTEIRRLKDAERRLTDQLNLFSQKRERDGAIEVNNVPAHMEQQQPERTNQPRGPIGTKGFVIDPSPVISTLQTLFGRPEQIVHIMIEKVRATPPPKSERLETLISFGLVVQNLCAHLKAVGLDWHLSNPSLLQELVDKLPANVKFNWALYQQQLPEVDLNAFSDYMARVTSATSSVTLFSAHQKFVKEDRPKLKEKAYINAHSTMEPGGPESSSSKSKRDEVIKGGKAEEVKSCPACNEHGHPAGECEKFKELNLDARWNMVKEHKLCRRCLISHLRWPCKGEVCGVNGCQKLHHRLLHYDSSMDTKQTERSANATVTIHQRSAASILFRVLPVTLYGKHGKINTLAFLDDGSSVTLIEQTIANSLGLDGRTESLWIQWTSGINKRISDAQKVHMEISALGSDKRFKVGEAYTVEGLGLPEQSLDFEQLAEEFKYLKKLPVQSFQSATPGILIGIDNAHLLATLKLREGRMREPIATKTRIGWAVYGRLGGEQQLQHRQMHICSRTSSDDLHEYVRKFFSLESLGIAVAPNHEGLEDQRARRILEKTTTRTDCGKFETGLLWKSNYVELPDSLPMAKKRLKCLEKRLQRNPGLYEDVRRKIEEFQLKGYIHEVSRKELDTFDLRRTWYLPLGVVTNPNKPGKLRLIWDAAAKADGESLNDHLLKGPDLLTPLLAVLFQFREREVAISADIMEMFLQILIRPADRSALLFLWRDSEDQPIKTMMTNVAIFGATCSPTQSQFVKNQNALEFQTDFPRASEAITKKHYVDDYLDSVDTIEEAVQLAKDVAEVHRKADFFIRNWTSNKVQVIEQIGEVHSPTTKQFSVAKDCKLEKLLGMIWLPEEDCFSFSVWLREDMQQLLDGEVVPSKRQLLSVVMSLYDPLGLVSTFIIRGKVLIQETWRENIGWDDKIPFEVFCRWKQWLKVLKEMNNVKVSRCYFPGYDRASYDSLQLHIFVDASEESYAAAAYFRIVDKGEVRCSLVASKTKVAPLQSLSIPRLELMAALIGARLRKTIEEYHSVKATRTYLWSDSTTVVAWIQSDTRRYRQFVAFRVNEILSLSSVTEWRWIGTRQNVADEATRWGNGPSTNPESRWYRGPAFLYERDGDWMEEQVKTTKEEMRPAFVCPHFIIKPTISIERFSKFERLRRCLAYVLRYLSNLRNATRGSPRKIGTELSRQELQEAEQSLWILVQSESFPDEVAVMKHNKQLGTKKKALENSSKIAKLPPMMDEQGVLRVDGRMDAAEYLPFDARNPIILPREHHVTVLLLDWYHRRYRHANDETVLNELRQRFYVAKLRTCLRKTKSRCMWCKIYKSAPLPPKMAPLPRVRLTPHVRAFTFIGIDYFGPYLVKVGRSAVKRWGVVFTCLTIRAVHIEVARSLSADSCKKAIRRFIARRGAPQEIYSDNGTNFVGVSRELRNEILNISEELGSTFTDTYTQWRFNPPSAPHMGGCWERMVRSIKAALSTIPADSKLDDESLETFFAEAEMMINSRPLTFVSLLSADEEAISPNHFLLLSSTGVQQPVKEPVSDEDGGSKEDDVLAKPSATEDGGFKKDDVLVKPSATCGGGCNVQAPRLKSQNDGPKSPNDVQANVRKDKGD